MIPAYCTSCGLIFDSNLIAGSGRIQGLTLINCSTSCPKCGSRSQVIEGEFNWSAGSIEVLSAPRWTLDILEKVRSVLGRSEDPESNKSDLVDEIEGFAPEVAKQLRPFVDAPPAVWRFIAFIIIIVLSRCSIEGNVSLDINRLVDQAASLTSGNKSIDQLGNDLNGEDSNDPTDDANVDP